MHRSLSALPVALLAVWLTACSDSGGPDARFACLGDTLPSTAPSTIHITGRISSNALNPTALGGAEVLASHTGTDTLAADAVNNVLLITSSEFAFLAGLVGVTPVAGDGFIGVIVNDCQGNPIAGATVTTTPAGTYRYNSGSTPSSTATSTSADGVAYVANVTAGNVTVQANASGHALRQHIVNARADAVTLTEIQP